MNPHWTTKHGAVAPKAQYKTIDDALRFMDENNIDKFVYHPYVCPECGMWHIGHIRPKKMNKDVPAETIIRYITRERDRFKQKLAVLVPYTKSLEKRLRAQQEEREDRHDHEIEKYEKRISVLEKTIERLTTENSNLIKDYRNSEWFKSLERANKQRRAEMKTLREALNRVNVENAKLKASNDHEEDNVQ